MSRSYRLRCTILGSLEVSGPAGPVKLGGRKRRALVAYLLLHHDRPVPIDRVVDDLWEGAPSRGAEATVQTYVSQLRRQLAPIAIAKQPGGYALQLGEDDELDLDRFEQLVQDVVAESHASTRAALGAEALALWQAPPFREFAGAAWAEDAATRLVSMRSRLLERFVDALLELDRPEEAIPLLETTLSEQPLDERFWAQLVIALARNGRQSESLSAIARARRVLAAELGIEPGPELRELEQRVLDQHQDLAPRAPRTPRAPTTAHATTAGTTRVATFVMTDIVESTRMWEAQPNEMSEAVARHEQLIAAAVHRRGGQVVKHRGEGDSTLSVFELASQAVEAAVAIVESMRGESWSVEPPLRVRVAVHTGEAEVRDGDYFGGALNRAARLRALADANEALCSQATAELVADRLPDGMRLIDRGTRTLRGLRRPEVVHALQGGHPGPVASGRGDLTVLGTIGAGPEPIASAQLRRLLARLLLERNRAVPETELASALWGDDPPPTERNALQSKISRLRSIVGSNRLTRDPAGYRLVLDGNELDADYFEELCERAQDTTDPTEALSLFDAALALWRGAAYGELADASFARAEAARLEARRRSIEDRRLMLIAEIAPDEALAESEKLLAVDPFRESAWAIKLRTLALVGRRVEALRAFHEYRTRLAAETGLTPSAQLTDLERSLLDSDADADEVSETSPSIETRPGRRAGTASPGGPLWTGPIRANRDLVGRERELSQLRDALTSAVNGDPRIVVLTGEAGIGKTRLLDELCSDAGDRDCIALRASALSSQPAPLSALRSVIAEVAPELAADPTPTSSLSLDGEAERQLWMARARGLADAIIGRANTQPIVLAIDDIQLMDDVSLAALEYVHASVADAARSQLPLLVVATHRSIGAEGHVLARIDRIARSSRASEIRLGGLDEPALTQLVADATSIPPAPALVDALGNASGNPLLSIAILQSFADARALVVRDGCLQLLTTAPTRVPYDVREVLASLVRDLDARDKAALTRIALLGDAPGLELVRRATGWSDDELIELLQRGERAGLLNVVADRVAFAHDLLRWSLAQAIPGSSKRRMHRELSDRLASNTDPNDADAVMALSEQLRLSGDRSPQARLGYWCELAGDHALARAVWSTAIINYDAAIDASDTQPDRRAAVRLKAGIACFHHHDLPRARARLVTAVTEFEEDERLAELGQAALVLHHVALTMSTDRELLEEARSAIARFLDLTAGNPAMARLRARALAELAEARWGDRERSESRRLVEAARRVAADLDDDEVGARIELAAGLGELADLHLMAAAQHFARSAACAARAHDPIYESSVAGRLAYAQLLAGTFGVARRTLDRARERQHAVRFWSELSLSESLRASLFLLGGDASSAADAAHDAFRYYERSGYPFVAGLLFPTLAASQLALANEQAAQETITSWRAAAPGGQWLFEIAVLLFSGERREAQRRLETRPLRVPAPAAVDFFTLPSLMVAGRIARDLLLHDQLTQMLPVIDGLVERGVLACAAWPTFLPQLAADIARAIDDPDAERRATFATDAAASLAEA